MQCLPVALSWLPSGDLKYLLNMAHVQLIYPNMFFVSRIIFQFTRGFTAYSNDTLKKTCRNPLTKKILRSELIQECFVLAGEGPHRSGCTGHG